MTFVPHAAALAAATITGPAFSGPLPDLRISSVDDSAVVCNQDTLIVNGDVLIEVANTGEADVAAAFDVLLFEDDTTDPDNTPGQFDPGIDVQLGVATVAGGLAAGESTTVTVTLIDQPLLFCGNALYALADSTGAIAEASEANNVGSSGDDCLGEGKLPSFEPALLWNWNPPDDPDYEGDPAFASWANVMVTPAVGDVTGPGGVPDGVPDVVFPSTNDSGGGSNFTGVLRVVDGQTGDEWYSVTDESLRVTAACSPAIADIDGDGLPEIICSAFPSLAVRVFEHDGTHKWDSDEDDIIGGWNAISVANIDPPGVDPLPEIIARSSVINRDGTVRWTGPVGATIDSNGYGISYAVDYDLDGEVEIIVGDTIYDSEGEIELSLSLGSAFTAIADFDGDDRGEIVTVISGVVRLHDDDGSVIWSVNIPGGGFGGPPTIADFDNDGEPEVGVVGATRYIVIDGTGSGAGTIIWQRVVSDTSSNRTGSSVFDFEGDGFADVVYRDQTVLYLMDGATGDDKAPPIPLSSCTWTEYVLVADVDADAHAEIIAVANNNCGFGPQRGVYTYQNVDDNWVNTREVWNQHAYHITNVNDDLTVPEVASINWLFPPADPFNNFRQNLPSSGIDPLAQADLAASRLRPASCGSQGIDAVTVRVGNGGAAPAGSSSTVAVYDPAAGPAAGAIGSAPLGAVLMPGEFEDVTVALDAAMPPGTELAAAADAGTATYGEIVEQAGSCGPEALLPGSIVEECEECNNVLLDAVVAQRCPADLNCDGTVDFLDLKLLLSAWGVCDAPLCMEDIDGSGTIGMVDLLILLDSWGPCD